MTSHFLAVLCCYVRQEIRVMEGIFKHCFLTIPFQHIRLFLWWDDEPLSSSVMPLCTSRDSSGGKYFQTLFLNYTLSTYSPIFMVG